MKTSASYFRYASATLNRIRTRKIEQEYQDLMKLIAELKAILADEEKVLEIIREELTEVKRALQ